VAVFLDGEELADVVTADDTLGVAVVRARTPSGKFQMSSDGHYVYERREGTVKITGLADD
jgi:hypothetical protein